MTYRPKHQGQFEPVTKMSPHDCIPATCALMADRATVGAIRVSHKQIRAASANQSTGMYMAEGIAATKKVTGVQLQRHSGLGRNDLRALVASGRPVGLLINCQVTRYTTRRTNFYTGLHAIYLNEYNWWGKEGETCSCEKRSKTPHAEYQIDDPGTTQAGYLQWSAELVYKAAEAYIGSGIYCLSGPDTEGVAKTVQQAGKARQEPDTTSAVTRSLPAGKVVTTIRSLLGGEWTRSDGTKGNGWYQTQAKDYVPGKRLG